MNQALLRLLDEDRLAMWCPGCKELHQIRPSLWSFDNNWETPTITPSILVQWGPVDNRLRCHSFIKDGKWEFLSDCTHELAGQTVDMVPLPDYMQRESPKS